LRIDATVVRSANRKEHANPIGDRKDLPAIASAIDLKPRLTIRSYVGQYVEGTE
jgi:hypothetical protein